MGEESRVPALSRRVPGATAWPTPVTRAKPPALPESLLQRMRAASDAADAITMPIPVISAPRRPAQAPAEHQSATALPVPADQLDQGPAGGRAAPAGRRYRGTAALVSALVLIAAGSLAFLLSRHFAAPAARAGLRASADAPGGQAATRDLAAAWVAGQVSRAAVVSCDQVMCQALEARGIDAGNLIELGQGAASPLRSDVIVATAAVRAQFGSRLSSVYAPAVIASFGSADLRIDIRAIAPHGAAAYSAALSADLLARQASGAELLRSQRISVSVTARRQLAAGQVDSRLLITIAGLAALHPVRVVAFGDSAPGPGAGGPLRSASLADGGAVPGTSGSAYARSMLAFLHAQGAPYLPAHARTERLASGRTVLRIEFAAPSPLGLLNPHAP
jgi:hypothetical protein